MDISRTVAATLIEIGAVGFAPEKPITFKSGIISPIYVDNRTFPFHSKAWKIVIEAFAQTIKEKNIKLEVIAGVEAAGIPHSAALGFFTSIPSVFVRKQAKDHGTKKMVEGGNVENKKVLLIEDLVSTGISSLSAIASLRSEGAIVTDCMVIVSYGFTEALEAFEKEGIALHALTSVPKILEEAEKAGVIDKEQYEKIKEWYADPHGWGAKYGFK
jgi:orotate phosphoribosyltransferase